MSRLTLALAALATLSAPALAQTSPIAQAGAVAARAGRVIPQRETAIKILRPVTIQFQDQRLEDVMNFIRDFTGADIDPKWIDDNNADGLDKEKTITLRAEGISALQLLEMVLERAESEFSTSGNTWQFTSAGTLEVGPRERLNKRRRVEIYNIADLLTVAPPYTDAPDFDLDSILQSGGGGGGGGGQSPFSGGNQNQDWDIAPMEERAEEIREIITELVEPDQWVDNGGDAASIRYWQGNFIVNAPDYVHRELSGYPWWPASATRVSVVNGRRYVSLNMDTSFAELEGLENQPVSAVVGGRIVRSDDPGGGG